MTVAVLDKKIANYLEQLNTRQKKAVLGIVKAFAEEESEDDSAFSKEVDKRTKELETGKVNGYTWSEVKKITRRSLSEMKKK